MYIQLKLCACYIYADFVRTAVPAAVQCQGGVTRPKRRLVGTVYTNSENDEIHLRRTHLHLARLHDLRERLHASQCRHYHQIIHKSLKNSPYPMPRILHQLGQLSLSSLQGR